MKRPCIGAHVATAGGIENAARNAQAMGAECLQIFGASPRQWKAQLPSPEAAERFRGAVRGRNLGPVYLHAAYLANLSSARADVREKSVENLALHLQIGEMLGARGLIFHIGSGEGIGVRDPNRSAIEKPNHETISRHDDDGVPGGTSRRRNKEIGRDLASRRAGAFVRTASSLVAHDALASHRSSFLEFQPNSLRSTHSGSDPSPLREDAKKAVVSGVSRVLDLAPGNILLLMENAASSKKLGAEPGEVGELLERIHSDRLGVCLDTAHACGAGNLRGKSPESVAEWCDAWDGAVGLSSVLVLHANDSRAPCGSGRDLHENIGEGFIGLEGFSSLADEPRLRDKDWILEVPGVEGGGPDKENVDRLKALFE